MTINSIDQIAEDNFKGLTAFITTLRNRSKKRGGTNQQDIAENEALDILIETFDEGARIYFERAKQIVQKQKTDPNDRSQAYHNAMAPIVDHIQLLSNIVRPFLAADDKKFKTAQVIEKIVAIIATRLDGSRFMAIPSPNFQYIHFNYVANLGVIGIPPHIMAAPSWHLGILWHEVAGQTIVKARRKGDLARWTNELSDSLQQKGISSAYQAVYQGPGEWQTSWLGEFFEDLFGVQVIQGAMVEVLAEVLTQRYNKGGNQEHPPINLRLQVALEFLSDAERQSTLKRLTARYGLKRLGLDEFDQDPQLKQVAQEIAAFYKQKVEAKEFSSPDVHPIEKGLAQIYKAAVHKFFETEESQRSQTLQEIRDELDAQISEVVKRFEYDSSFEAQPSDNLWTIVKNDNGRDVAIFFPNGVKEGISTDIESLVPQLEKAVKEPNLLPAKTKDVNGKKVANLPIGDRIFQVSEPDPSRPVAVIVVEDVDGKELIVDDFDSLLKIQFAEDDECCPWLTGP